MTQPRDGWHYSPKNGHFWLSFTCAHSRRVTAIYLRLCRRGYGGIRVLRRGHSWSQGTGDGVVLTHAPNPGP